MPADYSLQSNALDIEADLRARKLLNLPVEWADEIMYPAYDGLSIRNIPHTIANLLNAPFAEPVPLDNRVWGDMSLLDGIERVVLFLSDGLGYLYLRELMDADPNLESNILQLTEGRGFVPITSIAPTTTAVALPSLWTGASPATHGMLGTLMFLREYSTIANMLSYTPVGDPYSNIFTQRGTSLDNFVDVTGFAQHLANQGVSSHLLLHQNLMGTGLSRILHRGVTDRYAHGGYSDFWMRFSDALHETAGQACYLSAYYPAVDGLSHLYGAKNKYVYNEIRQQFELLKEVLASPAVRDGKTLLIVTADHGHIDAPIPINLQTDTRSEPIRRAMRTGLAGDMRLGHLQLRNGTSQWVLDAIAENYADSLSAVESSEAIKTGLFGTDAIYAETYHRLGDVILIPRGDYRLLDPSVGIIDLVSVHAGLSAEEMFVPFIWSRI